MIDGQQGGRNDAAIVICSANLASAAPQVGTALASMPNDMNKISGLQSRASGGAIGDAVIIEGYRSPVRVSDADTSSGRKFGKAARRLNNICQVHPVRPSIAARSTHFVPDINVRARRLTRSGLARRATVEAARPGSPN
jgi:hypothetical protein